MLDGALRELVRRRGADAAPLLRTLADQGRQELRKVAKLAIYGCGSRHLGAAAPASARPVIARPPERAVRAWLSGIDGSGSRAVWILFEGGLGGGLSLCSLILNDESGILEVAGGPITRKRLERELDSLREHQKLPWVDSDPARAGRLVAEALDLHARLGTEPPRTSPGGPVFSATAAATLSDPRRRHPPRSTAPCWIARPSSPTSRSSADGSSSRARPGGRPALLQARESRLIVSDRSSGAEAAIIEASSSALHGRCTTAVANRLSEMTLIFRPPGATTAAMAATVAAALGDEGRPARAIPLVRALVLRARDGQRGRTGPREAPDVTRAAVRPEHS